jgi:multicomponent Na+:H+ antiporter subunit C
MGVGAFVLALIYRAFRLSAEENIANDPENSRLAALSGGAGWLDADRRSSVEYPDTDEPDELDARPRSEGSR